MPPVLVGAGVLALGKVAGTALVVSVLKFAAIGAVVGVATALVTGGDPRDAAIKGALAGAVTGGVLGVAGAATATAGTTTAGSLTTAPAALNPMTPGIVAQGQIAAAPTTAASLAGGATQEAARGGLLSKMGGWIEANPSQAAIVSQTLGGAAQGMQEARTSRKEIDALMERDRLNRESTQISGLTQSTVAPPSYKIDSFLDKPKWQLDNGLLSARSQ